MEVNNMENKSYTIATETVTTEDMTPREKQIFSHGYNEGFQVGFQHKQAILVIITTFICFCVLAALLIFTHPL